LCVPTKKSTSAAWRYTAWLPKNLLQPPIDVRHGSELAGLRGGYTGCHRNA